MFDCFDPVTDIGPVCRYFAHDERILAPLRALYDDEAYLLKDKLIFKPPGAKGYALHQDYIGWPEFPKSFITVILAIDATTAANGATEVFGGLHQRGCLTAKDGDYHELPPEAVAGAQGTVLELRPGDLALFGGYTPHRSGPNTSSAWRRQLYLSYNASRDGGEQRAAHYRQFHDWLKQKYAQYGRTNVYFA
jgi:ectoine hydroxylase-related dioxygenase (phytanoyl-CoA dioxygenase family)